MHVSHLPIIVGQRMQHLHFEVTTPKVHTSTLVVVHQGTESQKKMHILRNVTKEPLYVQRYNLQ